jgi:predicted N-acyltransferase
VPFTPATGPRILTRDAALALPLLRAAETLCKDADLSSAHATFIQPDQVPIFEEAGWLIRHDLQFHWKSRLCRLRGFPRPALLGQAQNLRKERAAAQEGVEIRQLTGDQIRPEHWDAFWRFYQDTGSRKWGSPYLTRRAFTLLGETMADQILLVLAFIDGRAVAGALNFIGGTCLYGRYWGALVDKPFLHFELCYYQAIDAAIALGLSRVEAGAQGPQAGARL